MTLRRCFDDFLFRQSINRQIVPIALPIESSVLAFLFQDMVWYHSVLFHFYFQVKMVMKVFHYQWHCWIGIHRPWQHVEVTVVMCPYVCHFVFIHKEVEYPTKTDFQVSQGHCHFPKGMMHYVTLCIYFCYCNFLVVFDKLVKFLLIAYHYSGSWPTTEWSIYLSLK